MTTVTSTTSAPAERVVLRGVSWDTYEALLRDLAEQHFRLTYDRGTLEIMSPFGRRHGRSGVLISRLVESFTFELGIPIVGLRNVTWKSESLAKGLEADECYYIANAAWVATLDEDYEIRLPGDPPPDLAIEVDITSSTLNKESIYASLGVPELWRWEDGRLQVRALRSDGTYERKSFSAAIPQLPISVIEQYVSRRTTADDTTVMREFTAWVRSQFPHKTP